jgi:hypothetical protein
MISPKLYEKQIRDLKIEGKEISPKTNDEARIILEELVNIEKILERIRYNIRMDIRAIRKDYMEKIKDIGDSSKKNDRTGKWSIKNKIKEKRQLIDERDFKIAPYESIEYIIDDYLGQIKGAKKYLINFQKKL